MRTADEIVQRIHDLALTDALGFERNVLLQFIPGERAIEFIAETLRESGQAEAFDASKHVFHEQTRGRVLQEMREYMPFAWGKAIGHRGISACRSVAKFSAWLWLLEDADLVAMCEDSTRYPQYGAPILKAICDKYGSDVGEVPAGLEVERMAAGLPCVDGCQVGCSV